MERKLRTVPAILAFVLIIIASFSALPVSVQAFHAPSTRQSSSFRPVFQKGMQYSTWSSDMYSTSLSNQSLELLRALGVEWVGINVFWYQTSIYTDDIHPDPEMSPTDSSVACAIARAHELGMKVMLRPVVDPMDGNWRGLIVPTDGWFAAYEQFVYHYAELAQKNGVELFSVGCELASTTVFADKWQEIINGVKSRYSGPIVYCADWLSYKTISWWSLVDYVGIDAYFPLTNETDPSFEELREAWVRIADEIETWQEGVGKPVIFTEIGYRSVDGTNMEPWNYTRTGPIDLEEQALCYRAVFEAVWNRVWFYGMYWWYWDADPSIGGPSDDGYSPNGKPAGDVVRDWYGRYRPKPELMLASLGVYLLEARADSVYFIFPEPSRMTEPVAAYDVAAGGIIYGMCSNSQNLGFDSNRAWVDENGKPTLTQSTIVLVGGPYPHNCVRYYEEAGLTPVRFRHNTQEGTYEFLAEEGIIASLPTSTDFSRADLGLIEVFEDDSENLVYVVYGFTWRGTLAAALYLKDEMAGHLSNYPASYYVIGWTDRNGDAAPQTVEIAILASG